MKKRALVIGINHYEDKANINLLKYAEQDASAMRYFLQRRCGFEVTPLMGRDATRRRISNATFDICRDLKGEDLFVFYFAGHGYEDGRGHLLLASDVLFRELKTGMAPDVVPVRGLEEMTAERGCSRLLILDACRSPLEKGREGMAMLNEEVARDIGRITEGSGANPPLAVLCSCSPKQRAHEVDELQAGAFTEALVTSLESRLNESRGFSLPGDLEVLTEATNGILKRYGIADRQDPWCTSNRGVLALIEKVACSKEESTGERAAGALGQFFGPSGGIVGNTEEIRKIEICALCGLRNETADTFRCVVCGKGYLCRDHFVKKERCCEDCAKAREQEKEEARKKAEEKRAADAAEAERLRKEREERERVEKERNKEEEAKRKAAAKAERLRKEIEKGNYSPVAGAKYAPLKGLYAGSEEAQKRQREWVEKGYPLEVELKETGMVFRLVPPGEYMMGAGKDDGEAQNNEKPQHKVKIYSPLYVGKYPLTQRRWQEIMWKNSSRYQLGETGSYPVERVSWNACKEFIERLNNKLNQKYGQNSGNIRLLTEAEWEYACRAGTVDSRYGDLDAIDWYRGNIENSETHPVGEKLPNAWGLHDMIGNVREWCEDNWHDSYQNAPSDGRVWSGYGRARVVRGGGWYDDARDCRSSYRSRYDAGGGSFNGFRVVVDIE